MILVTGSTGFVSQALIKNLLTQNHTVRAAVRNLSASLKSSKINGLASNAATSHTLSC